MKRALKVLGGGFLGLLLLLAGFFFWASSGRLPDDALAQLKRYDAARAPATRDTLTVVTYNIGYLSGMTNNEPVTRDPSLFRENMDAAAALIREANPDIVGFQEIDFGAARSMGVQQLDTLATRLGYARGAQAVNWDERYLPFPYSADPAIHFGRVLSGQAVLSRYPIRRHRRVELARTSRPFWSDRFYLDRLAQVVVVDLGGQPLALVNVHLEAFEEATRETQAAEVRTLVRDLMDDGMPVLLIGDFNSVIPAAMPTMPPRERTAFAGDQTMARLTDGLDLQYAFPDSAYRADAPATYPADNPTRMIDHILYPPDHVAPVGARVLCGAPSSPPSDHCAVSLTFRLRASERPGAADAE